MDIRKLQRAIVDGLEDVKAQRIEIFNTEHLSPLFERVVIASGSSNRQTKALASSVRESVKGAGFEVLRTEGEENGEWIIVDCGAVVVHVMQPQIRDYYHLEEIWGEKPVKMKLGATKGLVKASEDASAKKAPAKKTASKSGGSRRAGSAAEALKNEPVALPKSREEKALGAPAKKAVVKKASPAKAVAEAAPAKKPAVRKAPAKKSAPLKVVKVGETSAKKASPAAKPAAKKAAPVKKAAAPAKPAAVKRAPAKKAAPAKAPVAKKAPAKKTPAKKAAR